MCNSITAVGYARVTAERSSTPSSANGQRPRIEKSSIINLCVQGAKRSIAETLSMAKQTHSTSVRTVQTVIIAWDPNDDNFSAM